jgi:hypothetical protein
MRGVFHKKRMIKGHRPYCTGNPLQMDLTENLHTFMYFEVLNNV